MPAVSGLDIAAAIARSSNPPVVVFVTADEEHALAAFLSWLPDYLPAGPPNAWPVPWPGSVNQRRRRRAGDDHRGPGRDHQDDPAGRRHVRPSAGDYARLHTADASYLIRVPLADLEQQWADAGFIRTHRSYLVALKHVSSMKLAADGLA